MRKRMLNRSGSFRMSSIYAPGNDKKSQGHLEVSKDSMIDGPRLNTLQNVDSECEGEFRKIKDELQQEEEKDADIRNLEDEMLDKKKKIGLKLKNYNFTSANDVFENRKEEDLEEVNYYGFNKETLPEKPKLSKAEKKRIDYEIKREMRRKYVVTQKKLFFQPRKVFAELVYEEKIDSDDN
jgi:hypothetical protein